MLATGSCDADDRTSRGQSWRYPPPEGREVALLVVLDDKQLDTDVVEFESALVVESLVVDLVKLRVVVEKQVNRCEVAGDAEQIDASIGAGWAETVQLLSPTAEDPSLHAPAGQQIQHAVQQVDAGVHALIMP